MIIARARNGGSKLAQRDIRNAEFLAPFRLEKRSSGAIKLAEYLLYCVTQLDWKVEKLKKAMQNGWSFSWDKIGESEYVKGGTEIVFGSLHNLSIKITLPAECPEALGRDIFGRAKRHIEKWKEEDGAGIILSFQVEGGTADLRLSKTYSKP